MVIFDDDDAILFVSLNDGTDQDDDVHRIKLPIDSISENMVGMQTLTKNIALLEVRRLACFLKQLPLRWLGSILKYVIDLWLGASIAAQFFVTYARAILRAYFERL